MWPFKKKLSAGSAVVANILSPDWSGVRRFQWVVGEEVTESKANSLRAQGELFGIVVYENGKASTVVVPKRQWEAVRAQFDSMEREAAVARRQTELALRELFAKHDRDRNSQVQAQRPSAIGTRGDAKLKATPKPIQHPTSETSPSPSDPKEAIEAKFDLGFKSQLAWLLPRGDADLDDLGFRIVDYSMPEVDRTAARRLALRLCLEIGASTATEEALVQRLESRIPVESNRRAIVRIVFDYCERMIATADWPSTTSETAGRLVSLGRTLPSRRSSSPRA